MRSGDETKSVIRRFLVMGSCSAFLHGIIAAFLFLGASPADEKKIYRVEIKRLQPVTEQAETIEPVAPEQPERKEQKEVRKEAEEPAVVDLTAISTPIPLETAEMLEESIKNADIVETPVPPAENVIITQGGGNSLLASGTGRGRGGPESGEGRSGVSGSPGNGSGTGGGNGGDTGNSRGRRSDEETGVYFAGMPGIVPPGYSRTPQSPYPEASRKRGEEGNVLLKVEVLANGRVGRTEVSESSGFALLDEAALKTVRSWRFKPALKGREEVACWVNIPIRFNLR